MSNGSKARGQPEPAPRNAVRQRPGPAAHGPGDRAAGSRAAGPAQADGQQAGDRANEAVGAASFTIVPLSRDHDRSGFRCGLPAIDNFLKNNARKDHERYKVRVFVAAEAGTNRVLGFYSLCLTSLVPEQVGQEAAAKFARVKAVPAVYLAMLGVRDDRQGHGIGSALMRDAFERALVIADHAGTYAIALDAVDAGKAKYYQSLGFEPFAEGDLKMYLSIGKLLDARR